MAARALTVNTDLAPHRITQRCAPIPVRSVTTPSPQVHPRWVRTGVCRTRDSRQSRLASCVCRHGCPDSDHGGAPPTRSFPTWDAWHPMQRTRRLRGFSAARLLPSCSQSLAVHPPNLERSSRRHTCQTDTGGIGLRRPVSRSVPCGTTAASKTVLPIVLVRLARLPGMSGSLCR